MPINFAASRQRSAIGVLNRIFMSAGAVSQALSRISLLKLAFFPRRIAQRHQHFRRLLCGAQRFEHVTRGGG